MLINLLHISSVSLLVRAVTVVGDLVPEEKISPSTDQPTKRRYVYVVCTYIFSPAGSHILTLYYSCSFLFLLTL